MWDFLRRIPELLGLKLKGKPGAPGLRVVQGGKAAEKKPELRGRGTGRGLTPPTPAKRSGGAQRSRKK